MSAFYTQCSQSLVSSECSSLVHCPPCASPPSTRCTIHLQTAPVPGLARSLPFFTRRRVRFWLSGSCLQFSQPAFRPGLVLCSKTRLPACRVLPHLPIARLSLSFFQFATPPVLPCHHHPDFVRTVISNPFVPFQRSYSSQHSRPAT